MKKSAICYFCNKRILEKRDYVIFNTPRLGLMLKIAHRECFIHYEATHPLFNEFMDDCFRCVLNSYSFWLILLLMLLIVHLSMSNSFIIISVVLILAISARLFFVFKYE